MSVPADVGMREWAHDHYRPGTNCTLCARVTAPGYRRDPLVVGSGRGAAPSGADHGYGGTGAIGATGASGCRIAARRIAAGPRANRPRSWATGSR